VQTIFACRITHQTVVPPPVASAGPADDSGRNVAYRLRMVETGAQDYALQLSPAELERYRIMAESARQLETELWRIAGIVPGATVADVGCGPGAMFPAIVESVEPTGRLIGVDGVASTVAQAQALVDANGWPNVTVQLGKADDTGLPPGEFDAVMMRHVLAHNGAREQQIVDHLATLLKPGGHVYLVDIHGAAMYLRPEDPDITELSDAYVQFHAAQGNDLKTGLRLDQLVRAAGLELVDYRGWYNIVHGTGNMRPPAWAARDAMIAAGVIRREDLDRYEAALDRMGAQEPTIFAPVFGAVGRRS
jgi:ubiquinone/menaquinone biosynthesis C-methylase UbiE